MPQIRFRAIEKYKIKKISKEMVDELQKIIGCPREYFILEIVQSSFIWDENEIEGNAFVEVVWFDRGQEIQDKTARCITDFIKGQGIENLDIAFTTYKENSYYENGEHF